MILSISVISYVRKYLFFTLFVMIFGYIYECFSHDVYTVFMQYAYLVPLFLGLIPFLLLYRFRKILKRNISITLYNNAVITVTIYAILRGVLEIYGTTNTLLSLFLYEAALLFFLSITIKMYELFTHKDSI